MNQTKQFETFESMCEFIRQNLTNVRAIDYDDKTIILWTD